MKRHTLFCSITLSLIGAPSLSRATPPPQVSERIIILAELLPGQGTANRFSRRDRFLPSVAASLPGVLHIEPLFDMAPERVSQPNGPSEEPVNSRTAIMRRTVKIEYGGQANAAAIQAQLQASGRFRNVRVRPQVSGTLNFQQSNEPLMVSNSDQHRWQWALPKINAPGTWSQYGSGRARVSSIEGGLSLSNPDVQTTGIGNVRLHVSPRLVYDVPSGNTFLTLGSAGQQAQAGLGSRVHHGTHVNTIMVAPINSAGMAGVCPSCTLQTIRAEENLAQPIAVPLIGRFGATAVNISFGADPFQGNTEMVDTLGTSAQMRRGFAAQGCAPMK